MWARIQLLLAAVLFSTGGAAIKGVELSAWEVACYRSGIAALTLLVLMPSARRGLGRAAFGVGVAYATTLTLFVGANKLTTSANAIFLQSTAPLYLLLLAPWLLKERTRTRDVVAMAGIALGLAAFFVGTEEPRASAPDPLLGDLLGAGAGLCWAVTVLGLRALGRREDGAGLAPVVAGNLVAFAACLPFALAARAAAQAAADAAYVPGGATPAGETAHFARDLTLLLYLGVFQIGLAYVFVTRGLRKVTALEASLLLMAEPALNPFWAWLSHGEVPGPWALGGGALILGVTVVKAVAEASGRDGPGPDVHNGPARGASPETAATPGPGPGARGRPEVPTEPTSPPPGSRTR